MSIEHDDLSMAMLRTSQQASLSELCDIEAMPRVRVGKTFRIGLLIPMCGAAGIWAPSCISSAQVAVAELNDAGGIACRQVELIMIDSALEAPTPVEEVINSLIETHAIDAIVGMHISAVRQVLSKIIRQRVPYVYTPLYEGGECTNGIFAIGDTPDRQLGPALEFFKKERNIEKWALIGNDYVWPRASNEFAKTRLSELGAGISLETYLPFGIADMDSLISILEYSDAEGVLISLVGQDAVTFNRAFGQTNLHNRMLRFSCAIEENGLLACGEGSLKELYSSASYFGSLETDENRSFREKYYRIHGETAPVLNALGQSTYEGVHFLSGLMKDCAATWQSESSTSDLRLTYRSVRRCPTDQNNGLSHPMYLAKANGIKFNIIKTF